MIQVPLALLADYANVSREGKINILGVFDQIYATSVPALHPQMQLVMTIVADRGEAKKEHKIKIELIDQDNIDVSVKIEGTLKFDPPKTGEEVRINQTILLNHVVFNKYGEYSFKIVIDGEVKRSISLKVMVPPTV
jgi:hypothetical protein